MSNSNAPNKSKFHTTAHPGSAQQSQSVGWTSAGGSLNHPLKTQYSTTGDHSNMEDRPAGAEGGGTGTGAAPEHQEQDFSQAEMYLNNIPCKVGVSFRSTAGEEVCIEMFEVLNVCEWQHLKNSKKLFLELMEELNTEGLLSQDLKNSDAVITLTYTGYASEKQDSRLAKLYKAKEIFKKSKESISTKVFHAKGRESWILQQIKKKEFSKYGVASAFIQKDGMILVVTESKNSHFCFAEVEKLLREIDSDLLGQGSGGKCLSEDVEHRISFLKKYPLALVYVNSKLKEIGLDLKLNSSSHTAGGAGTMLAYDGSQLEEHLKRFVYMKSTMCSQAIFRLYSVEDIDKLMGKGLLHVQCKFMVLKSLVDFSLILVATDDVFLQCEAFLCEIIRSVKERTFHIRADQFRPKWRTLQNITSSPIYQGQLVIQEVKDGHGIHAIGTQSAMTEFSRAFYELFPELPVIHMSGAMLTLVQEDQEVRFYLTETAKQNGLELNFENDTVEITSCGRLEVGYAKKIILALFKTIIVSLDEFETLESENEFSDIFKKLVEVNHSYIISPVTADSKICIHITGTVDIIPSVEDTLEMMRQKYSRLVKFFPLSQQELSFIASKGKANLSDITSNSLLKVSVRNSSEHDKLGVQISGATVGVEKVQEFIENHLSSSERRSDSGGDIYWGHEKHGHLSGPCMIHEKEPDGESGQEPPKMRGNTMHVSAKIVCALKENHQLRQFVNQCLEEDGYLMRLLGNNKLDIYAGSEAALQKAEKYFHSMIFEISRPLNDYPVHMMLSQEEIRKRLTQQLNIEDCRLWINADEGSGTLTIVGSHDIKPVLEEELKTLKKMFKSSIIDLGQRNLCGLRSRETLENDLLKAEPRFRDIVKLCLEDRSLLVVAPTECFDAVTRKIHLLLQRLENQPDLEMIQKMYRVIVPLTKGQLELVQKPEVMDYLDSKLEGYIFQPDIHSQCMIIYTLKKPSLDKAEQHLKSCFKEQMLDVETILQTKNATLHDLETMLMCQDPVHEGKLYVNVVGKKCLQIVCTSDICEDVLSCFEKIKYDLSEVMETMAFSEGELIYLQKYFSKDLEKDQRNLKVQIQYIDNGLELNGQKSDVDSVKETISVLTKGIFTRDFSKTEDEEILQSREGRDMISEIEQQYKCVITGMFATEVSGAKQETTVNELLRKHIPKTASSISIIKGKIDHYRADVLVLPVVDGDLSSLNLPYFSEGDAVKMFGKTEKCDPVWIPCPPGMKYGIVALCWMPSTLRDAARKEKETIRKMIKLVLKGKSSYHHTNLPSSAHIFLPFEHKSTSKVTKQIVTGVAELCLESDRHKLDISMLVEEIDKKEEQELGHLVDAAIHSTKLGLLQKAKNKVTKKDIPPRIKLVVGNLEKHQADVLVNSVSIDLEFKHGMISNILNKETNGELERQCKLLYPQRLHVSEVAVTPGCGLKAKHVFHGNLNPFHQNDPKRAEQCWKDMKNFITGCLTETVQRKLSTIAFPALGSGRLAYPQTELVPFVFNVVEDFLLKHTSSCLRRVDIVLHRSAPEIIQLFYAQEMARNYQMSSFTMTGFSPKRKEIVIGNVMVQVIASDLSECDGTSEGMLCFWDPELLTDPKQHPVVGKHIQEIEFSKYEADLNKDGLTLTLGGNLPSIRIVHVLMKNNDLQDAFLRGINAAVRNNIPTLQIQIAEFGVSRFVACVADSLWRSIMNAEVKPDSLYLLTVVGDQSYCSQLLEKLEAFSQENDRNTSSSSGFFKVLQWTGLVGKNPENKDVTEEMDTNKYFITAESPEVFSKARDLIIKRTRELKEKYDQGGGSSVDRQEDGGRKDLGNMETVEKFQVFEHCRARINPVVTEGDKWTSVKCGLEKFGLVPRKRNEVTYVEGSFSSLSMAHEYMCGHMPDASKIRSISQAQIENETRETEENVTVSKVHFQAAMHLIGKAKLDAFCHIEDDPPSNMKVCFINGPGNHDEIQALKQRILGVIQDEIDLSKQEQLQVSKDKAHQVATAMTESKEVYIKYAADKHMMIMFAEDWEKMARAKKRVMIQFGQGKTARGKRRFADAHGKSDSPTVQGDISFLLDSGIAIAEGKHFTVKVYKKNITKLSLDVIVNAANENLSHGGGVARAIVTAGGQQLDDDGKRHVRQFGPIPVSELAITVSGNLPCTNVFHAVGPKWTDYTDKSKCQKLLCCTILRCLCEAVKRSVKSIAFPAISSAIYGVPQEVCAKMYVRALKSFDTVVEEGSLKEIHFVDISDTMIAIIQSELESSWRQPPEEDHLAEDRTYINQHLHSEKSAASVTSGHGAIMKEKKHEPVLDLYHFNDNVSLNVVKRDILHISAKAIVSWEDFSFSTDQSNVKKLLDAGGNIFRKGRENAYNKCRNIGDTTVGPGGSLPQELVIFTMISANPKKSDIVLYLHEIFKQCTKEKMDSVVLPVLPHIGQTEKGIDDAFVESAVDVLTFIAKKETSPTLHIHMVDNEGQGIDDISTKLKQYITSKTGISSQSPSLQTCPICLEEVTTPTRIKCGHQFCKECIDKAFLVKKMCPICKAVCGVITGNMPPGTMSVTEQKYTRLPGYDGCGTLTICYSFPRGIQTHEHPAQGKWYEGIYRTAYLPNNAEGQKVLSLLKVAWDRRLTFTIGRSVTMGKDHCITWNEIHHKTKMSGGETNHGYPDPDYLRRVQEELAAQGVTEEDLGATGSTLV